MTDQSPSSVVRHAQIVKVKPELRAEYLRLHEVVWPEVEATLRAAHITNYSIFVHGDVLIAYYEYTGSDYEADQAKIAADPKTQEWWTHTDPCQTPFDDDAPAGTGWVDATEAWHLA